MADPYASLPPGFKIEGADPMASLPPGFQIEGAAPSAPYGGGATPDQPIMKGREVGLGSQFVGGFASDDAEAVRYFAKTLYPDEPVEQSAQRFGMRGKKLYHRGDDGNLYEVIPKRGARGMAGSVASGAGKAIPAVAGAAAGILTAPLATTGVGAAGTMAAAYAGGAGGEMARQKLGDVMMGAASTGNQGTNYGSVAGEGLLSAAGQAGGVGVGAASQRSQVRDIARFDPGKTAKSYDLAGKYGVPITPGQATGLKTVQAEEKRLATRVPETSDQMQAFLQKQSSDIQDSWYRQLETIAPSADAEQTGKAVRTAAEGVLEDVSKARRTAAKPLYQAWERQGAPVDTAGIIGKADTELATTARGGATAQVLQKVRGFLTNENGSPITDAARLHNARVELSNIIDTRSVSGTSLNNTIVGKLQGIKKSLTEAMDAASTDPKTGQSLYKQARSVYSDLSEDVDDAFGSALARIAKLNDTNILNAVRETFNPATRSPEMIGRLKTSLQGKDPQAWQSLKRLWLQDEIGGALRTAQSGEVINPGGKIVAALEDAGTKRSINAALSMNERASLDEFKILMRRISNANLRMGSDTAANLAADKAALTKATPIWASALRKLGTLVNPFSWTQGVDRATEMAAGRNARSQAKELVDLVTSGDRNAINAMRELKKLTPGQWRALAASGQFALRAPPVALSAARSAISSVQEGEE